MNTQLWHGHAVTVPRRPCSVTSTLHRMANRWPTGQRVASGNGRSGCSTGGKQQVDNAWKQSSGCKLTKPQSIEAETNPTPIQSKLGPNEQAQRRSQPKPIGSLLALHYCCPTLHTGGHFGPRRLGPKPPSLSYLEKASFTFSATSLAPGRRAPEASSGLRRRLLEGGRQHVSPSKSVSEILCENICWCHF